MSIFFSILVNNIIPIFILISLGILIDKKFILDINTLTKISLYLIMPAFIFVSVFSTDLSSNLIWVILFNLGLLLVNFIIGANVARLLKLPNITKRAFENTLMFTNSGNIGISLITLVFTNPPFAPAAAPYLDIVISVQVMVLLVQNIMVSTFGLINSGGDEITWKEGLRLMKNMPSSYAVFCALLFKLLPFDFTATPVWPALEFLRNGLMSTALLSLGVQISKTPMDFKKITPYVASFFRLIVSPVAAYFLIRLFGFEGVVAQALLISSSTPVAINVVMQTVEYKGDADFCVQTVALSTLLSALTMTIAVYLAYVLF